MDTEGDRSCHGRGARLSELTFKRLCRHSDGDRKKRPGGLGGHADSQTHIHTHTSVVRVQLMWRDRRRGLHSPVFTPMTLWSNLGLRPGFHIPTNTHTQDKSRRTLVHTHTRKKTTPKYTHTAATAAPIMKTFFLSKKKQHLSVPAPSNLAPPLPIISGHHCS